MNPHAIALRQHVEFLSRNYYLEKRKSTLLAAADEIDALSAKCAALEAKVRLWKDNHRFASNLADELTQDGIKERAHIAALQAENARLREFVEKVAGLDCRSYDKYLSTTPCGVCTSCRARDALAPSAPTASSGGDGFTESGEAKS